MYGVILESSGFFTFFHPENTDYRREWECEGRGTMEVELDGGWGGAIGFIECQIHFSETVFKALVGGSGVGCIRCAGCVD